MSKLIKHKKIKKNEIFLILAAMTI
jgi:hypothetical protein